MNEQKSSHQKQNFQKPKENEVKQKISRRSFFKSFKGIGLFTVGSVMGSADVPGPDVSEKEKEKNSIGSEALVVKLNVNGRIRELTVSARETLADTLRDHLQLTGTKVVCNRGSCSACTVLLDGVPVNACMVLVLDTVGKEVSTIESLAVNGELHPLQQAFIDNDATQCGFCTPGMLMSSVHLLQINPHPTIKEIKKSISGNLCRCGTYPHVFKAVQEVADMSKRD